MPNPQATWKQVWAAVRARQEQLGWTDKQIYERCSISQTVYAAGRQDGRPLKRADKIASLEDGLGWSRGSVAATLAGGEPTVAVADPTGSATPPDALGARVEQLEQDLHYLIRSLVDYDQSMGDRLLPVAERLESLAAQEESAQ